MEAPFWDSLNTPTGGHPVGVCVRVSTCLCVKRLAQIYWFPFLKQQIVKAVCAGAIDLESNLP